MLLMSNMQTVKCFTPEHLGQFHQCQAVIKGVLPIDYFLAKQIISFCYITDQQSNNEQSENKDFNANNKQISDVVFHLLILLSMSLREGHTCVPLTHIANLSFGLARSVNEESRKNNENVEITHNGFTFPSLHELINIINATNFAHSDEHPIVLAGNALYLRRYYLFEQALQIQLRRMSQNSALTFNTEQVKNCLHNLFLDAQPCAPNEIDWQKVAVANALNRNFSVIAGGPGTGKTYTVTKLLAALIQLTNQLNTQNQSIQPLKIALVAPTGKAAQRLSESIVQAVEGFSSLISADVLAQIPTQAQTIHRLLGVIPNQADFRHHAKKQLAIDVLLIDEVSMVDLPLMTRLLAALPTSTRVIMLGDADQLPSVEVGSVLADIAMQPHPGFSANNQNFLVQVTGYENIPLNSELSADHCVFLTKSRRFDGEGGIGLLAQAVIQGNVTLSWQHLNNPALHNALTYIKPELRTEQVQKSMAISSSRWLDGLIKQYYAPIFNLNTISEAFTQLSKFRVLCATRKGEQGVEALNKYVEDYLFNHNLIPLNQGLYQGKPIMISTNHYGLGLYNGDIGIAWRDEAGHLRVGFEKSNNEYLWVLPSRLPEYETVYAMTIHKTQGSEFSHVAMALPQNSDSKLLSRELLYTGITRAKNHLSLIADEQVLNQGIKNQVQRYSGLSLS